MPAPSPNATGRKPTPPTTVMDSIARYLVGGAGIPRTSSGTEVGSRHIRAASRIFLTVDTTQVPGADVALPGVRVNNHGNGWLTVSALDESVATGPSGVPFSYLVVNELSGTFGPHTVPGLGPRPVGTGYTTGTATVPAGATNVGVNARS